VYARAGRDRQGTAIIAGRLSGCRCWRRRSPPRVASWEELADGRNIHPVEGEWRYLHRAVDKDGNTIDFLLGSHRGKAAARRYFEKSVARNSGPETGIVGKSALISPRSKPSMMIVKRPSGSAAQKTSTTLSERTVGQSSKARAPCPGSRRFTSLPKATIPDSVSLTGWRARKLPCRAATEPGAT
jgi:hypothetical protein